MNLDATYREMGELRKVQAANESTAQRAALYAEGQAKEGLKAALDQQKIQSQRREEALLTQIFLKLWLLIWNPDASGIHPAVSALGSCQIQLS
eukprot:m.230562 g.230562  ORF g.230562 m.230562 type:complete len:93 (+) comp40059_c0_seq79:1599-1877(+)